MNAPSVFGAKCIRLFVAFGLALLLAGPAVLLWASRSQVTPGPDDTSAMLLELERQDARLLAQMALPKGHARNPLHAPFGETFRSPALKEGVTTGLLVTNLGHLDADQPEALLGRVPEALRLRAGEATRTDRGTLVAGLNYARLSRAAIEARRGAEVDAALASLAGVRVQGYLPEGWRLIYAEPKAIGALRQMGDLDRFVAVEPAFKIDRNVGRRPLIERARAESDELRLEVFAVSGADMAALRREIGALRGVSGVAEYGPNGLLVEAHYASVGSIARLRDVLSVEESLEYMTSNALSGPTLQAGSFEDTLGIRPFDEAGVDGGGIDTNGDGQRTNAGLDAVPPQIVAVTDNGLSYDTPNFSQTATQPITITNPIGPSHRKVHAIHPIRDNGTTCDGVLFGSGTHGHVVASAIAAYPSQLGFFASRTRNLVGGAGVARSSNLDGVARGARILMQDVADTSRCTINSIVEKGGNVDPGRLLERLNETICPKSGGTGACTGLIGGANEVHLAVLPFGAPDNFSTTHFLPSNGTYPQSAADLDIFMANNLDYLVLAPVGNSGSLASGIRIEHGSNTIFMPDLFNGTAADNDPNVPRPVQIAPPSTAKNVLSVGASRSDCWTVFTTADCEINANGFSSRGPASPESLRMAPLVTAPGSGLNLNLPFETASVAVFRSRDNDNTAPIDAQIDEANFGTSYSAASVTGAAAIVRDYFAQGLYPTGSRVSANRVPNVSGALVKAAIVAGAKFGVSVNPNGETLAERDLRRTRSMDVGSPAGVPVGVLGNSEQGYGRALLTGVLPLANWSKAYTVNPNTVPEFPAQGLLVWDAIATGEPLLTNAAPTRTHTFRVMSPNTVTGVGGGLAVKRAELRVALAWTDAPSPVGSGGPLINDLDLVLEGPGPDGCLFDGDTRHDGAACGAGSETDNVFYDGNVYFGGRNNAVTDQWSRARGGADVRVTDRRNPQEAIHLNSDPSNNFTAADASRFNDSPLHLGTWRVTVEVGQGGSNPGMLTLAPVAQSEDANGNWRLDAGEDANGNGLLDLGGQPYALVVAGPVFLAEAAPSLGPAAFPQSFITLDRIRYSCASSVVASLMDTTSGADAARAMASTTFTVRSLTGAVLDTEASIGFTSGGSGSFVSAGVPVRLASPAVANNGILEADTGTLVYATYAPPGQAAVEAGAQVKCSPEFVPGFFATPDGLAFGSQVALGNGCDDDEFLDAGETVTYGIAINNRSRTDDYADVVATLTPSGPGATAVRVLDSPRDVGRIPGSGFQGMFFHVHVDAAAANALALADRKVTMTLTLESVSRGQRIARQSYSFTHAINSDRETLHYSTDFPAGGRQVRDLNRNLLVDRPDVVDPFLGILVTDEDVTFSSLWTPGTSTGLVTNTLGEDLNNNGVLDAGEDTIPNGVLDRGILFASTGPTTGDKVPWTFDTQNGGWVPLRHPGSTPGTTAALNVWEYKTNGVCGFQTSGGLGKYGIWHTGDGNPDTPSATATACDNHAQPRDAATQTRVELIFDVLHSPIIAKVNQVLDSRGFEFGVEFQRAAFNINLQTNDAYAGGGFNIDNNIDNDNSNCMLCEQLDTYYTRRLGGWTNSFFRFSGQSFPGTGIDPVSLAPRQRTFGPLVDPGGGTPYDNGNETGFTGFTQNTNADSLSPIPQAPPDFIPYPLPGAPVPGVCSGGSAPGDPCQTNTDCAGGGTCTLAASTVAGPARNFDLSLIGYEGGSSNDNLVGTAAFEDIFTYIPGLAGNRWQLGLGFFSIENTSGLTDYGFAMDDTVFEWDEHHPKDETAAPPDGLGRQAACDRFGGPGQPAGGQCATITVDRTQLYECEEALEITVVDPKLPSTTSSIEVAVVTDSDSVRFATIRFSVLQPNAKRYTLLAVPGSPGLFRGTVTVSGSSNNPNNVFANPATDSQFIVYYVDTGCDGDRDGQVAESHFDNRDGDGVAFASDNCPFTYNPGQEDADGDGVGDLCDNCPLVANPDQADANADDVGDVCEFDDIDGDGVDNATDNCPDVYNPLQEPQEGNPARGAACGGTGDIDGDGVADNIDNCVLVSNGNQRNADNDTLGNRCDGDCAGAVQSFICSNAPATSCTDSSQCPAGGVCQSIVINAQNASCSTVDDDADADGVPDSVDNCAAIYNPAIIPGTFRQRDSDRDGLGDECDPAGSQDDDFDGVPDDLVTFQGSLSCRALPLARFAVLGSAYEDLDGDRDIFPDTGETGRVAVTLQNLAGSLTGATFTMTTTDPDVACITSPTVVAGSFPAGAVMTVGSLDPGQPGFTFRASDSLQTTIASNPARIDLCLAVTANEALGASAPICFNLLADLNIPEGAEQIFTVGPDGIAGTGDDGTIFENFDVDRDGDGNITVLDTFRAVDAGTGQTVHGSYVRGSDTGVGENVVAAVPCGGFTEPAAGNPACALDPDFPMDWHLHCAPGATNCPNLESGACVGGCSFQTPTNGQKAFSPPNSLHMGAHFNATDRALGDTTHFRTLQGFMSPPINLALFPRVGDLQLSMFHIARLMDNNGVGGSPTVINKCADCGDVQVQVDLNPDPAVDEWGVWDKLAPFQNVYDHKFMTWSVFSPVYCLFTPTDTGTEPPAPRGVHELMCAPLGAWSSCGSVTGTSSATTLQCPGPGFVDPSGIGVWVETRFNLAGFLGQRIRVRWIGSSWVFDLNASSYYEYGGGWDRTGADDGWWLDNIRFTGTITEQLTPTPDEAPAPPTSCPAGCDTTTGDRGTSVTVRATDLNDVTIDGVSNVAASGQAIRISAVGSSIVGGCSNGTIQFRFMRNGVLAQDWSSKAFLQDAPESDTTYSVLARCSSDFACTSQTGATLNLAVYEGDATDIALSLTHDRASATTSVRWTARPQQAPLTGYDVYRATVTGFNAGLGAFSCFATDVAQATPGSTITVADTTALSPGQAQLYLVGHSTPTAGARAALGRASNGTVRIAPVSCP
jgi:hypothetical protein